jgi:putative ABC transport system permease protein
VLGFSFFVSILAGLLFGLAPALQSSRWSLLPILKGDKVGADRKLSLRNILVVGQVALSLALLTTAGLFLRSLYRLQNVNPGFETENLLIASVDLGLEGYSPSRGQDFYRRIDERVGTLPGVRTVSLAQYVPLTNLYMPASATAITIEGRELPPDGWPRWVASNVVGPRYFETMGISIVQGRGFGSQDAPSGPRSVMINEAMAREFWPAEDPVGKRISLMEEGEARPAEVIGVARDSKYFTLWEQAEPYLYLPLAQNYISSAAIHVRTEANPTTLLDAVRHEVHVVDPNLPIFHVSTLNDALRLSLFPPRMGAALLGGFGFLALLLAAVGIYGVMTYAASRRTHEIGIRLAVGARARDVLQMILSENLILVITGIGFGLAGAWTAKRLLSRFLYGVTATDPMTLLMVTLLLITVAFLACFAPARRATNVDPSLSLRYE